MIKAVRVDKEVLSRLDQQQSGGLCRFLCVERKAFTAASMKTLSSKMTSFLSIPGPVTAGQWGRRGVVECRLAAGRSLRSIVSSEKKPHEEEEERRLLMRVRYWWMNRVFPGNRTQSRADKKERFCFCDSSSPEKMLSRYCTAENVLSRADAWGGGSGRVNTFSQLKGDLSHAASKRQTWSSCGDRIPLPLMLSFSLSTGEYSTWRSSTSSCVPSAAAVRPVGFAIFSSALATTVAARGLCCTPASVVLDNWMTRAVTTGGGLAADVAAVAAPSPHVAQLSSMRFKLGDPHSGEESRSASSGAAHSRDSSTSAAAAVVAGERMRKARALQLFPFVTKDVEESPQRKIHFSTLLTAALRTPQQQQHVGSFLFEELRCRCALQIASLQLLAELLQQADTEASAAGPLGSSPPSRSKSDNSSNSDSSKALGYEYGLPALQPLEGWLGQAQEALLHQFGLLLLASNALKAAKKAKAGVAAGEVPYSTSESGRGRTTAAPGEIYYYPTGEESSIPEFTSSSTPTSSSSHSQGSDSNTSSMTHNSGSSLWAGKKNFLSLVHALRSIHAHVLPRVVAGSRASFNATLERLKTHQQQRQQAWQQQPEQEQGIRTAETGDKKKQRPLEKEETGLEKTEVKVERVLEDFVLRGVSIGLLLSHFELLYHQTLHHMQNDAAHPITAKAGAAEQRHVSSRNPSLLSSKPRDRSQHQQQRTLCTGTVCSICDTERNGSSKIRNSLCHPFKQNCLRMENPNSSAAASSRSSSTTCEERYTDSHGSNTERSNHERRDNVVQISSSSCAASNAEERNLSVDEKTTPSVSCNTNGKIWCIQSNGVDGDLVCGSRAAAVPVVLRGNDHLEKQQQRLSSWVFPQQGSLVQQQQQQEREVERGYWWGKDVEERQQQHWLTSCVRSVVQQQGQIQQRAYSSMVMQQRLQQEEDHDRMDSYPAVGMIKRECSPAAEFRTAAEKVHALCCRDLGAAPSLRLFVLSDTSEKAPPAESSKPESESSAKGRKRASSSSGSRFSNSTTNSSSRSSVETGGESAQLQLDTDRQDVSTEAAAAATVGVASALETGGLAAAGVLFPSDAIRFPAAVLQYVFMELLKNAMRATLHRWYLLKEDEEERLQRQRPYQPSIRLGQRYQKHATGKQQQNWRQMWSSGDETAWEWQSCSKKWKGQVGSDFRGSVSDRIGVECLIMRTKEGIWIRLSDRGVGMDADARKAAFKCLRKRADLLADAAQRFFGGSTTSSNTSSSNTSSSSTSGTSTSDTGTSSTSSSSDGETKRPDFFSYSGSNYGSNWRDVHRRSFSPRAGGAAEDSGGHERSSSGSAWTNRVDSSSVNRQRSSSSAEPKMSGFGVGLVLTRAYVQYFGGNLLMHSTPEDGTDVYLFLPFIDKTTENLPDHPALLQRAFETAFDSIQDEISLVRRRGGHAGPAAEAPKMTDTAKTRPPDAEGIARGGDDQAAGRTGSMHSDAAAAAAGRVDPRAAEKEEVRRRLLREGVPPILIRANGMPEESSARWKLVWHKPEWEGSSHRSS